MAESAVPPLSVMSEWERRAWEVHVGTWTSQYVIRDAAGTVIDSHSAINDIALDWDRNLYSQRNIYTRPNPAGSGPPVSETRRYTAFWDGSTMKIEGKFLRGEARAYDEQTLVLSFEKPSLGEKTYETIIVAKEGGGRHRGRVQQIFEEGVMKRVTSVFDEVKVADAPGISAEGEDL